MFGNNSNYFVSAVKIKIKGIISEDLNDIKFDLNCKKF